MSKKTETIITVLCVFAVLLSAAALIVALRGNSSPDQDIQYVMYLGTNDKDTNEPVFTRDDAKAKAEDILIKHFGGYTIQEAEGGWLDGDKIYQEYSFVIYLSDTNRDQIHAAADELLSVFNQSSVLIQANQTVTEFYAGVGA